MNKVIVAGSINMDIVATTERHPKIGETVFGTNLNYFPGGKGANQAVAASKLGSKTIMLGKVGSDGFGKDLIDFLTKQDVINQIEKSPTRPTGTALITVSSETSNNTIVVVPGANFELTENDVENFDFTEGDVLVSQFEIPLSTIKAFFKKGHEVGTLNILNPAPAQAIPIDLLLLVDILILNETELEILSNTKVEIENEDSISRAVNKIRIDGQSIIVTLGEKGAIGFMQDIVTKVEGRKVKAVDTTGAGDCFVGAIASKLTAKATFKDAVEFANLAASICVTKQGAGPSMPTLAEVNSIYQSI